MKKTLIYLILTFSFLLFSGVVFAKPIDLQVPIPVPGGELTKSVEDLGEYISIFYQFFVTSAGILATVMIILGGYRWIVAAGNAQKIGEAKETIISAVLGLVLALTSYILLNTINPAITSLKPLTVPALQQFTTEGMAEKLCDFDQDVDGTGAPIECGETLYIDPDDPASEQCLGVRSLDNDNYCKVTEIGGLKMGIEASETTIANHPSNQQIFDVSNGPVDIFGINEPCGLVFNTSGYPGEYEVANNCPELAGSMRRCVLNGETGIFAPDPNPSLLNCNYFLNPTIKGGCGKVTNMFCQS